MSDPQHLSLVGGFTVDGLVPATGGQNNWVYFGSLTDATEVVVKVEGESARLAAEHRALVWAAGHGVAVPRVLRFGRVGGGPYRGCRCLVVERVAGRRPVAASEWWAMGVALAGLAGLPVGGSGLRVAGARETAAGHEDAAGVLAAQLPASAAAEVARAVAEAPVPGLSRVVPAHGDPGPGNFLVGDGGSGWLIDWETAGAAPLGLDPARAAVLAMLGAGPGDAAAEAQAAAVWRGYAEAAGWRPDPAAVRWWLTVACLQFLAGRWRRRGQPRVRPWEDAVSLLARLPGRAEALAAAPGVA